MFKVNNKDTRTTPLSFHGKSDWIEAVVRRCSIESLLRNFEKFTGKHLCQCLFFNKGAGLSYATLLKKRLWHSCFPVNFPKSLRTTFFTEYLRWLVLIGLHFVTRMKINPISCKFLTQVSFNHYREQQHFQVTDTPNNTISINTMLFGSKKTR